MRRRIVEAGDVSRHECHAHHCTKHVPPRLLMCRTHWGLVPKPVQDLVWRTYRVGQEITKTPSIEYLSAHHLAIALVARAEGFTSAAAEHKKIADDYAEQAKKAPR